VSPHTTLEPLSLVRIAVDCMGGDHGPAITLPACRAFLDKHPAAELVLVGGAAALDGARNWPRCRLAPPRSTARATGRAAGSSSRLRS